jgi:hypothetical protein
VIKAKVGDVADFVNISLARLTAGEMARSLRADGRNPNTRSMSEVRPRE